MLTYTAKKEGKSISFINRKMAISFIKRGYNVEVYKDGKKIYLMKSIDKTEKM